MIGLGVFDCLAKDITDPYTGEIYPALSCYNDKTMAERCLVKDAEKAIWSIKASASFNSDCAFLLREGFRSGKVRLLVDDYDGEAKLNNQIKAFRDLSVEDKQKVLMPYIQTTLLIDELVKLQHDESNGKVRLYERSGMRKDRYSSLSYNYYVALQIEHQVMKRSARATDNSESVFLFRAPKIK